METPGQFFGGWLLVKHDHPPALSPLGAQLLPILLLCCIVTQLWVPHPPKEANAWLLNLELTAF